MSPLHARQLGRYKALGERLLTANVSTVSATQRSGVILNKLTRIDVMELGAQAYTFTGTNPTVDLQVRTLDAVTSDVAGSGTGTNRYTVNPSSAQLTTTGCVINRNSNGMPLVTLKQSQMIKSGDIYVCLLQLVAVVGGTTPSWSGSYWMTYVPYYV